MNEHICALVVYYYDNDNVTDNYRAFRERVHVDAFVWSSKDNGWYRGYEQFDYDHMEQLFGVISDQSRAVQNVGRVLIKEGRLALFPNVLQHRVEPFQLQDKTRPGHRKILALS